MLTQPKGVYLTDLTFIEDGIPSVIKKTNLINFAKRAKTAEVIRDIQQYQAVGYSLQPVPELQDYIISNMQAAGDVHEMYDKSLQVEPREREDEKIVRYVVLEDQLVFLGWTQAGMRTQALSDTPLLFFVPWHAAWSLSLADPSPFNLHSYRPISPARI